MATMGEPLGTIEAGFFKGLAFYHQITSLNNDTAKKYL